MIWRIMQIDFFHYSFKIIHEKHKHVKSKEIMFRRFRDIMTPLSRNDKIKMRVQKELKYSEFAWMKTAKQRP